MFTFEYIFIFSYVQIRRYILYLHICEYCTGISSTESQVFLFPPGYERDFFKLTGFDQIFYSKKMNKDVAWNLFQCVESSILFLL